MDIQQVYGQSIVRSKKPQYPTSRICTICGRYEYPESDMATTVTWICPECAKQIKRFIYPADKEGE